MINRENEAVNKSNNRISPDAAAKDGDDGIDRSVNDGQKIANSSDDDLSTSLVGTLTF